MRRNVAIRIASGAALIALGGLGVVSVIGGSASTPVDSQNIYAICQAVEAVCVDPGGETTTSTSVPTTSSTSSTTTTAPTTTTTQLTPVSISVTPFANGTRAHVEVVPNSGATVVVRNPSGVVISRGATGDIPANICCTEYGTYTWVADPVTPGYTATPGQGNFVAGTPSTTTTSTSSTTTTTVPSTTTTTTTGGGGESYVNPLNTGFRGQVGDLEVYSGPLTITSNTTIEGMIVRGEVRVCGNVTVTFRDVLWEPTSTNAGGRAFQVDGSNGGSCTGTSPTLILEHVTIDAEGRTQRGVSSQRGGVAIVRFTDISGVEDCVNVQGGSSTRRNVMEDSYCHHLDSPASSPHHDGIQIMGGWVTVQRNVIIVPHGGTSGPAATAAVFPKSDAGAINATVRENYLNGGGYTVRRCEGTANVAWTNNEIGPDHQFGAILGPAGGCTATVSGDIQVTYRPGDSGFHPGSQQ